MIFLIMAILAFLIVMNTIDAVDSYRNETGRDVIASLLWVGTYVILFIIASLIGR
jgi:hypothetical protein